MKKYVLYFSAQILSLISLLGYYVMGNYVFELYPSGVIFDVHNGLREITPYIYVEPITGMLGVFIQAAGLFLYCVCFGILAKFCKTNLNLVAKRISFTAFAIAYIAALFFLFTNNFAMLNVFDAYAIKEIWANAINFLICVASSVFGFSSMYFFKNSKNHLIYK